MSDFHSDATTHKEIEDGRLDSQGELLEYHNLCMMIMLQKSLQNKVEKFLGKDWDLWLRK